VPIGLATFNPYTLVARNDLPFSSLKDIITYARANPGKLTYASAGNGTGQHITAAVTFHLAGVQVTHVPYKGAGPAYQDLLPGRVDLFFDNSATAQPQIDAGRVKPIAVSGAARLASLPNVPTVRENGRPIAEVYLLDFDDTIYGKRITVEFLQKLRDEERFANVDALTREMHRDVARARDYFDATSRARDATPAS
jgi:tripartite-type tricarboxylate transporter receptor subunit TctC